MVPHTSLSHGRRWNHSSHPNMGIVLDEIITNSDGSMDICFVHAGVNTHTHTHTNVPHHPLEIFPLLPHHMYRRATYNPCNAPRRRYGGDLDLALASGWAASWKRYLLELMLVKDWFVMYPFINGSHAAYSTNHLEVGEHIKTKDDQNHKAEHYTFPLLSDPPPTLLEAPTLRFNHLYQPILNLTGALQSAVRRTPPRESNDTTCASYSRESHELLVSKGLTIVMGHFYLRARFVGFLRNVLTYCTYPRVRRIVVVWHNKLIKPPTMATCPGRALETTVHFLTPRAIDTLSNRFTPTCVRFPHLCFHSVACHSLHIIRCILFAT